MRDALTRAERARADAAAERGESIVDVAEAEGLIAAAESLDRAAVERQRQANERDERAPNIDDVSDIAQVRAGAENDRDVDSHRDTAEAFDSAERRERFASSLEGKADREVIDARITAAADRARHPREAVTTVPKRALKARETPRGQGQRRERSLGR